MLIGLIGGLTQSELRPTAAATAVLLIGAGAAVFLAENAEHLGGLSYRWGAYVGILCGVGATALLVESLWQGGAVLMMMCIFATPYAIASSGLLRRKRFGVVTFLAMWTFTVLAFTFGAFSGPFLRVSRVMPTDRAERTILAAVLGLGILVAPNYVYFLKRWKFLSAAANG
jgi:hypothetical protein